MSTTTPPPPQQQTTPPKNKNKSLWRDTHTNVAFPQLHLCNIYIIIITHISTRDIDLWFLVIWSSQSVICYFTHKERQPKAAYTVMICNGVWISPSSLFLWWSSIGYFWQLSYLSALTLKLNYIYYEKLFSWPMKFFLSLSQKCTSLPKRCFTFTENSSHGSCNWVYVTFK